MNNHNIKSIFYMSILISLSVISACIVLSIATYHALGYGCYWWDCAPKRNFSIYDLYLPKELIQSSPTDLLLYPGRGTVGATDEAHGASLNTAIYSVTRFATIEKAKNWYKNRVDEGFFTDLLQDQESFYTALTYQSTVADEYYIGCGYVISDLRCVYEARYEEYVFFFSGSIREGLMTQTEFTNVISYIDGKMKFFLAK